MDDSKKKFNDPNISLNELSNFSVQQVEYNQRNEVKKNNKKEKNLTLEDDLNNNFWLQFQNIKQELFSVILFFFSTKSF